MTKNFDIEKQTSLYLKRRHTSSTMCNNAFGTCVFNLENLFLKIVYAF